MRIHPFFILLLALPWASPSSSMPASGDGRATDNPEASLIVSGAWIRETPPGRTVAAGYLTVDNPGTDPVFLDAAASEGADRVEFHTHSNVDGMMRMRQIDRVEVPAGGSVSFAPGGLHLMLFGTDSPRVGAVLEVEFRTSAGARLAVAFPVQRTAPAAAGGSAAPAKGGGQ
mgnify:CR=1 FL=1